MQAQYDQDTYAWALEQASLLRAGKLDQIDIEHIAEEIESVGKGERRALVSQLARLFMHLLKWDHQPQRRLHSERISIIDAQAKAARLLNDNPSLKASLDKIVEVAYEDARRAAAIETEREIDVFPAMPLYSFADAMSFVPESN
ncbi:DUF29 domain-containing protein [Halomonas sp. GXIMD04776]|uniref:DUF29 domain-containing protein n=1 Tax=Halomonas sp. GXIMD04776 TaxID=3415605 RepID=UPI003CC338CC